MSKKTLASLSLDLDNKWAYLKTQGNPDWESFPSYFDLVVPRMLNFLADRELKLTTFVVGQDAVLNKNHEAIASIAAAGHEIANHSFNHEPWLHLYTPTELNQEFEKTEQAIKNVTGQHPVGFRGPGFSLSTEVLQTMIRRGYQYDCSTFPTFLGPVARAYYFFKSRLSKEQKEERKELFGSWKDGLQPNAAFNWKSGQDRLVEIPVTTMPIFKVPIHGSYLLYLGGFSPVLARTYFWMTLKLCHFTQTQPSLLLHPLDFMGKEDDDDLAFFPAMDQSAEQKINLLSDCLAMLQRKYRIVTMAEHADAVRSQQLREIPIDQAPDGVASELA